MKIKAKHFQTFLLLSILLVFSTKTAFCATYYLSPDGSDRNTETQALNEGTPWKSFSKAFSNMSPGDELILLSGTYSESVGTGYISYLGTNSSQPPSGVDKSNPTIIRAKNPGTVRVEGGLFLGRSTRKDSYINIAGISFIGGGKLYNTSFIYIKQCGFLDGFLGVGTNDHDYGNTYNLIEDCWVYAKDSRGIAMNYRADYNIWRRVVIRGDGCSLPECAGSGNPNVGFTVYNSKYCSIQNMIIIDRILDGGSPYGDFATAQHAGSSPETPLEGNEWLGCISINSEDTGYHMEADEAVAPSHDLKNCVVAAKNGITAGFNINNSRNAIIENCTTWIDPDVNSIMLFTHGDGSTGQRTANILAKGNAYYGINRGGETSHVNVFGVFSQSKYNNTVISNGEINTNPEEDGNIPSLKYIVRIEDGSILDNSGYNNEDIGASVIKRYGVDAAFWGDSGYRNLTDTNLWPWPNEEKIKADMREGSSRGFCTDGKQLNGADDITLTSYIWEYLGNQMPTDIYADNATDDILPPENLRRVED